MVKSVRNTYEFNETVWEKFISRSIHTQKSRSVTLGMAVDYFYEIVKDVKAPRDVRVESARKILVYDSLTPFIEDAFYKNKNASHQIGVRWENETIEKLTTISRTLCVPNQTVLCLAIYSFWESFNKEESVSILSKLEHIVAILQD